MQPGAVQVAVELGSVTRKKMVALLETRRQASPNIEYIEITLQAAEQHKAVKTVKE
jgi:hypothetical protein